MDKYFEEGLSHEIYTTFSQIIYKIQVSVAAIIFTDSNRDSTTPW